MFPTPNVARVDGLPAVSRHDGQTQAAPNQGGGRVMQAVSARTRARIERQTAVVREASTTDSVRRWLAAQAAEGERLSIRAELARAGLL